LHEWAGEDVLLRADHFFWLLGSAVQKTVGGLLRSLLHSLLLSLSRSTFPGKREAIKNICAPRSQMDAHCVWSRGELREMLIRFTSVPGLKSFLLVDALDECEPQDHLGDVANEILRISQLPNVKLCVSQRPWEIFTGKFTHASILRLDGLTLYDMETYVRDRLTDVESEIGLSSDFQDQSQLTENLIRNLAHAAEGVFLWTELITKAICSEMRKGKRGDQLVQVMADFPTDLDEYFHKLIFDRIGRSSRNVKDTAAALKLAVKINTFEQGRESRYGNAPFARYFINFWLLSNDHLKPGFSWQDYECIVQPDTKLMLSHTATYLEETCKDLLVLNKSDETVDFLHRTVYDFLTDKKTHAALEEDVPDHFLDPDFIDNLAKLRCMFIVREDRTSRCETSEPLRIILDIYQERSHLDAYMPWLLTCESLTISYLRKHCTYALNLADYRLVGMPALCMKAGLGRFVLEMYKENPHEAIERDKAHTDLLGQLVHVLTKSESRNPDPAFIRHVLEFGCDPNACIGKRPGRIYEQHFFESKASLNTHSRLQRCSRTTWQAWLGETYLLTQRRVDEESLEQRGKLLEERKLWFGGLVDLLLRYGADPHSTICITDHEKEPYGIDGDACNQVNFEELLEHIVPAESLMQLQDLRILCCDSQISHTLRRNRQKRAMKSLLTSEQNLLTGLPVNMMPMPNKEDLGRTFLYSFTGALNLGNCNECVVEHSDPKIEAALVVWCVECQSLSYFCLKCSRLRPDEVPDLVLPCSRSVVSLASRDEGHASVVFVWEYSQFRFENDQTARTKDYADLLHKRYPINRAITFLKDWYSKNPIESDLTFEEAICGIATLPVPFQPCQPHQDGMTGGSPSEFEPTEAASSQEVATSALIAPVDAITFPNDLSAKPEKAPKRSLRARLRQKFLS
jgi:hypothetical protein